MTYGHNGSADPVGISAWCVHVPHLDLSLLTGGPASKPACDAQHAHETLGRKGLLGKDAATRLALCAVHGALSCAPGRRPAAAEDPQTAVVASSNLGNYATVSSIAQALRSGSVREISPMDAPNASSNIVASTVAIWFGLGGPNLMVCSGAASGLDAVDLGCSLLRAGRARRAVVVGAEPGDSVALEFQAMRGDPAGGKRRALRTAAAAVVLQRSPSRGMPVLQGVHPVSSPEAGTEPLAARLIGPLFLAGDGRQVIDIDEVLGDTFGAQGVLQIAVAAELMARSSGMARETMDIIGGDSVDGWRRARIVKRSQE